jgi:glycosyltransferase involved in cell wall biosynthesis
VIIQENRVLSNYPLLLRRLLAKGSPKIAFWGHGVNFQSNKPSGIRERWKTIFANKVDWWFAYTEITKNIMVQRGFPAGKITCLNNTIDTKSLQRSYEAISSSDVESVMSELGVTASKNVCVFCGSLYKEKKINFMLDACSIIQQEIPDFHLIIIGDGPDRDKVKSKEEKSSWLHYVGPITDDERLKYFRISRLMINPGLLGLHILDSFTTGVPLVSTTDALHSPEIAYLQNGVNGILVTGDEHTYARAVVELLQDNERYARIRKNGIRDAEKYSIENMATNFVEGINCALRF